MEFFSFTDQTVVEQMMFETPVEAKDQSEGSDTYDSD